jgi:Tfp pilus tip-associated adhesin PilY1
MTHQWILGLLRTAIAILALASGTFFVHATVTDIASIPLGTSPSSTVLPNLMFVLDDSGSMARDYTPDEANDSNKCKSCSAAATCNMVGDSCNAGQPPYYAAQYNIQYYNPNVTYKPGVNYLGASLGNMTPTAVRNNIYSTTDLSTKDLVNTYRDIWWCTVGSPSGAQLNDTAVCRRAGTGGGAVNPFNWTIATDGESYPSGNFRNKVTRDVGPPHYYVISPTEHCSDALLTQCVASTTPTTVASVIYDRPAPMRWCRTTAATTAAAPVTGGSPATCRATVDGTYQYPRFGTFKRFNVVGSVTFDFPRATSRSDCSGAFGAAGCTGNEELQNFANWYGYYRTRMLQMKTVSGRVFSGLDERYRIGFLTINAAGASQYLPINKFETTPTTQKQDWFTKFYAQAPGPSTPLREALSRAGRHYAGVTTGINSFMPEDPIQFSCQRNYTLLTTDGYWNGPGGQKIDGSAMDNQDNTPGAFVSRADGTLDGVGTVVTVATPTFTLRQQICVGNANTTFPVDNTPCGCAAGQTRVKQQTRTDNANVIFTDGIQTGTSSNTVYSYQNITACTTPLIVTTVTPIQRFDEQIITGNNVSTFPTVNGLAAGANQAGVCTAGQIRVKQRETRYNETVVTTDGVAAPATYSGTTYFAFTDLGACVAPATTTTTTPVTEVEEWRGRGSSGSAPNPLSNFNTAANGTNPQTTVDPRCSSGNNQRWRRTLTYNRIDVQVGSGAPTTSYTAGSAVFLKLNGCGGSTPSAAGAVITNGTPSVVVTGGPDPVAAATTITPGVPVATNNGGTTVTIPLSPNPTTGIPGAPVSTTSVGGASNTLADVAMYYYKTDLRPGMVDNVKGPGATFLHQHMVTFTLGLGLDGQMLYDPNYETAASGDFVKIKTGATTCSWTTGTCNWPVPVADNPTALDDLWHAAVNGRGRYFSAKDPTTLENGLTSTLAKINEVTGAASSAATSTPNLTPTDNFLFSSNYRTLKWDGEVIAQRLDPNSGQLDPTVVWSAAAQLNARTTSNTDTRTIYTFDPLSVTNKLKPFLHASLSASEQAYFDNKCAAPGLPQCGPFDPARVTAANLGTNLVNWLRGQRGNELSTDASTGLYRAREFILGDTVNSRPVFVGPPNLAFADAVTPNYQSFKTAQFSRQKVLYIAANDGMLRALNADTGAELWAYVPKMIMPNLWKLASRSYDIGHFFNVDGSPVTMDVFMGGAWKTILVAGLNGGGRGYFALDVTDPLSPKGLWEICSDAALCSVSDPDMGLSYGTAIITKRHDGTPIAVVASGYNNVTPGNGGGYLFILNLATGAVLEKIGTTISGTNVGTITTPSGFAKVAGFATNFAADNTTTLVYGGDLLGNMWRFDLTATPVTVQRIARLMDNSATPRPQSITTRPEVTRFSTGSGFNVLYVGTGRLLGVSDLGDPASLVPPEPYAFQQTIYGFKDTGADLGNLRVTGNLVQQTMAGSPVTRTVTNNTVDFNVKNGWYVDLNPGNSSPGERVNLDLVLVRGTLLAATNEPNTQACSDGGNGFFYQFDYRSGSLIAGSSAGQISSALIVGFVVFRTQTGALRTLIRTATGPPIEKEVVTAGGAGGGQRVSWRELVEQ